MRRLFIKEMLEIRFYLIIGICIVACLVFLGDPLTFIQNEGFLGTSMVIIIAFASFIGLSIYSQENAKGSIGFVLSRPIKWWWIYLIKLIVGLLICTILSVFAVVLYGIVMPPEYRPFMPIHSLLNGAIVLWLTMSASFVVGFTVSCASSGFAEAIGILFGLLVLPTILLMVFFQNIGFAYWQCLPAILVVASIICVRLPTAANPVKRIRAWSFVVMLGLSTFVVANILVANHLHEANMYNSITSPSGEWTAYLDCENTLPPNINARFWMIGPDEHKYEIDSRVTPKFLMWLNDGDSLLYLADKITSNKKSPGYLMIAKRSNHWRAETVGELPLLKGGGSYIASQWEGMRYNWIDL